MKNFKRTLQSPTVLTILVVIMIVLVMLTRTIREPAGFLNFFGLGTQHETGDITIGPEGSHVEMMEGNSAGTSDTGSHIIMKTVFDNELKGWTNFSENQLLRCKDQKIYEAELLLNIHHGASFLDIGANYGDTVCTMAAYAKSKNRSDIRFYAFEPNIEKIKHIKKISTLNNLNITVYNSCVGYERTNAVFDKIVNENTGAASFKLDTNGPHKIIRLDDIKSELEPIGFMHIDTEGWDCDVLKGSREILLSPENSPCYIVAESWTDDVAKHEMNKGRAKGVATNTPKKDILDEMKSYSDIQLIRELKFLGYPELNLVFKKG